MQLASLAVLDFSISLGIFEKMHCDLQESLDILRKSQSREQKEVLLLESSGDFS